MQNQDVKVGMKVVPHSKTVFSALVYSYQWDIAKQRDQPYLFVNRYDETGHAWSLSFESGGYGDFFNASDFEPYQEPIATTYVVAADLPTRVTCWHDTYASAEAEAKRLCLQEGKNFRVLKVVSVVKPAQPTVIRVEE